MKDYLIVVDANFPSGARLALADAKKLSPKPVKFVFDTHHHGDHTYGNAVWTGMGATTIALPGSRRRNEALRAGALEDDDEGAQGRGGYASRQRGTAAADASPTART